MAANPARLAGVFVRRAELRAVGADRRVPIELEADLPADRARVSRGTGSPDVALGTHATSMIDSPPRARPDGTRYSSASVDAYAPSTVIARSDVEMHVDPWESIGIADRRLLERVAHQLQDRRRRQMIVSELVHHLDDGRTERRGGRPVRRTGSAFMAPTSTKRSLCRGSAPMAWRSGRGLPVGSLSPLTSSSLSGRPSPSVS